jgi:biotin synthase
MSADEIVTRATELSASGADHICLVQSGRGPSSADLDVICEAAERISNDTPMAVCASLGLLDGEAARRLKAAGVARYNHNLETVEGLYSKICRTHTWRQRRDTVLAARRAGMQVCCGGIIGLGETMEERIGLAFALKELGPELVPINLLNPRPGTALAGQAALSSLEAIKAIAIFRLVMPRSTIKAAGGREAVLRGLQAAALLAGADGLIVGGYLTTQGAELAQDLQMVEDCGFTLSTAQRARLAGA